MAAGIYGSRDLAKNSVSGWRRTCPDDHLLAAVVVVVICYSSKNASTLKRWREEASHSSASETGQDGVYECEESQ